MHIEDAEEIAGDDVVDDHAQHRSDHLGRQADEAALTTGRERDDRAHDRDHVARDAEHREQHADGVEREEHALERAARDRAVEHAAPERQHGDARRARGEGREHTAVPEELLHAGLHVGAEREVLLACRRTGLVEAFGDRLERAEGVGELRLRGDGLPVRIDGVEEITDVGHEAVEPERERVGRFGLRHGGATEHDVDLGLARHGPLRRADGEMEHASAHDRQRKRERRGSVDASVGWDGSARVVERARVVVAHQTGLDRHHTRARGAQRERAAILDHPEVDVVRRRIDPIDGEREPRARMMRAAVHRAEAPREHLLGAVVGARAAIISATAAAEEIAAARHHDRERREEDDRELARTISCLVRHSPSDAGPRVGPRWPQTTAPRGALAIEPRLR